MFARGACLEGREGEDLAFARDGEKDAAEDENEEAEEALAGDALLLLAGDGLAGEEEEEEEERPPPKVFGSENSARKSVGRCQLTSRVSLW